LRKVKKNNEILKEVISKSGNHLSDYEDIRSYATGKILSLSRPLGLDLFLKVGFLNWMQVQQESEVWVKPVKEPCIAKEFLPQDQEQEITMLLANMILEERSSHVFLQ
jgi:hypothetical protein